MSINISSTPFTLPTTVQLPPAPVGTVVTSTYSFASSDAQAYTVFNTSTGTVATISSGFCPVGSQLTCEQGGAGSVLFVSGSTAVVFNPIGPRGTLIQYGVVAFFQKAQNVWTCSGSFI